MPCLSSTWPQAAEPTAKSSSATLANVKRLLPGSLSGSLSSSLLGSSALDNQGLLGVRGQPHDPLVAEQRRAQADGRAVGPAHAAQPPTGGLRDLPERQPGRPLLQHVEAGVADEPAQGRPREEAQVGLVEDAAAVVAEEPERDAA